MKSVDLLIVGCGLAGSALAWQAHLKGLTIAIVERNEKQSCSMVAAGLVTPITGTRAAASWEWEFFFEEASKFYPMLEQHLQQRFWNCEPTMKIFLSEFERTQFESKWFSNAGAGPFGPIARPLEIKTSDGIQSPWGSCEMAPAAQLDTATYLLSTREFFRQRGDYFELDADCESIEEVGGQIDLPQIGIRANSIAFCQGVDSRKNRWFPDLPLHPARGDILTIDPPAGIKIDQVLHHDVWIVPGRDGSLRIGATYDRKTLDGIVDRRPEVLAWQAELLQRWERLMVPELKNASVVRGHQAAVRPASYDRRPLIGQHRTSNSAYCLNGLGSKGSLMAPALARILLDRIINQTPLSPQLDWQRPFRKASQQRTSRDQ